jgi:hypothetical protein
MVCQWVSHPFPGPVRWCLAVLLASAALGAGSWLVFEAASPPDAPNTAPECPLEHERRRAERQQAEMEQVRQRRRQRVRILTAVAAGRLPLFEAAARLRAVERPAVDPQFYTLALRLMFPDGSDGERMCRKVIHDLRELAQEGRVPASAADRLERELARHLRRFGTVRLPEVPHE